MRSCYGAGLLTGFVLGMLFSIASHILDELKPPQKGVEPPRFRVVDKYAGCDIVRWEPQGYAEYKFFLYCGKTNDN